jgi:hypothetical protein
MSTQLAFCLLLAGELLTAGRFEQKSLLTAWQEKGVSAKQRHLNFASLSDR